MSSGSLAVLPWRYGVLKTEFFYIFSNWILLRKYAYRCTFIYIITQMLYNPHVLIASAKHVWDTLRVVLDMCHINLKIDQTHLSLSPFSIRHRFIFLACATSTSRPNFSDRRRHLCFLIHNTLTGSNCLVIHWVMGLRLGMSDTGRNVKTTGEMEKNGNASKIDFRIF